MTFNSQLLALVSTASNSVDIPGLDWKLIIARVLSFHQTFTLWLDFRQLQVLWNPIQPDEVKPLADPETFEKTQAYSLAKLKLGIVTNFYDLALTLLMYQYDLFFKFWEVSVAIVAKLNFQRFSGEGTQTLVFAVLTLIVQQLLGAPLSLYKQFVLEEKFGFNKMTLKLWFSDQIKMMAISAVLSGTIMTVVVKIIRVFGDIFVVYCTLFFLVLSLAMAVIYPMFIDPLFNKNTPLEDGPLRTAINELAGKLKFPLGQIYVQDSSKRSSHSNAYFTGLPWFKRIVIFDTLIDQSSVSQVTAVLAHELGHWKLNHIPRILGLNMTILFFTFALFTAFVHNKSLFASLGFPPGVEPVVVAFFVFNDTLKALEAPLTFFQSWNTRRFEYEADTFAVQQGYADELAGGLLNMQKTDLGTLTADWIYSTYHFSHPILPERLRALKEQGAVIPSAPDAKKATAKATAKHEATEATQEAKSAAEASKAKTTGAE